MDLLKLFVMDLLFHIKHLEEFFQILIIKHINIGTKIAIILFKLYRYLVEWLFLLKNVLFKKNLNSCLN